MKELFEKGIEAIKPRAVNGVGAAIGAVVCWFTGLPTLARALLSAQGADVLTGVLLAVTGKSPKTASGKVSSGAAFEGVVKKGVEWLAVAVCASVGEALSLEGIAGAAMSYMIATELVSLMENLQAFGLRIPVLLELLDAAQARGGEKAKDERESGTD